MAFFILRLIVHSLCTRIDDIFDSAFEKSTWVNHFPLHTLTPLGLVDVTMYSDTKNLLTGVINSKADTVITTFVNLIDHVGEYGLLCTPLLQNVLLCISSPKRGYNTQT